MCILFKYYLSTFYFHDIYIAFTSVLPGFADTCTYSVPIFFLVCCCFPKSYHRLRQGESKFFLEKRALYRAVNLVCNFKY